MTTAACVLFALNILYTSVVVAWLYGDLDDRVARMTKRIDTVVDRQIGDVR